MIRTLVSLLFVLSVLCVFGLSECAHGRQDESDAAHFGVSYILTMTSYGLLTKGLGMPKFPARLFSGVIVGMGTGIKEFHDLEPSKRDMGMNLLGIGSAIGTTLLFEF